MEEEEEEKEEETVYRRGNSTITIIDERCRKVFSFPRPITTRLRGFPVTIGAAAVKFWIGEIFCERRSKMERRNEGMKLKIVDSVAA